MGPGSSVASESDPIKLCSAAVYAYLANLPAYVFHSSAGVYVRDRFEDARGVESFRFIRGMLPGDVASWARHSGRAADAPFEVFCNGIRGRFWPEVAGATNGCLDSIGSRKGSEFVCFPMGILGGVVWLEARQRVRFRAMDPLTGLVMPEQIVGKGERIKLEQGGGALLIRGRLLAAELR